MSSAGGTVAADIDYRSVPDVLKEILRRKQQEVASLKAEVAQAGAEHPLQRRLDAAAAGQIPKSRQFSSAIRKPKGSISVIAEIKRRSPSSGLIAEIPDVRQLSDLYYNGGAAAISVLTDAAFDGTLDDLQTVVKHQQKFRGRYPGPCPVLRKDFIIDEIQIAEAAERGAAAVLLIVAAIGEAGLRKLLEATHRHGLEALVEIHDEEELEIAKAAGAEIIGTNARDLRTFNVDLNRCFELIGRYPPNVIPVAESGIHDVMDAWRLRVFFRHELQYLRANARLQDATGHQWIWSVWSNWWHFVRPCFDGPAQFGVLQPCKRRTWLPKPRLGRWLSVFKLRWSTFRVFVNCCFQICPIFLAKHGGLKRVSFPYSVIS